MILYNTTQGVAAGAAMIAVAACARAIGKRSTIDPAGWATVFVVLGTLTTLLGGAMTLTWPLNEKPQVNILFGEPTLFLGVLLLASAALLWARGRDFARIDDDEVYARVLRLLAPVAWLTVVLGLVLLVCGLTVIGIDATGSAPPAEPISGSMPAGLENGFLGVLYLLAAAGTLPAPWAVANLRGAIARFSGWCLTIGGGLLLAYCLLNYYTHVGLLMHG
jgi:hypothetical protein